MGNREELEIPVIEFTKITLLGAVDSTCCAENCNGVIKNTGVGNHNICDTDQTCPTHSFT